ncbi:kinase-like domain-containing protein [Gautieria morchelliformis]|nr:kinase-like domain-containing protein [Gautieria morchelliformis]
MSLTSVFKVVNLFISAQVKRMAASQPENQVTPTDVMMLTYARERTRSSTVPIRDPSGTRIWLTRLIGQGGQARVFVGEREGVCYAVKAFHRQQVIDEGNAKHVRRELGILSHLTGEFPHPFIVQLEWAFAYRRNLFLIMLLDDQDWCPEDLHSRLASYRISRVEGKLYTAQLLAAIHHLHSRCIMHRDIKPSNILVDYQGNLKLSDFGYAIQFDSSVSKEMHKTYSRVGTRGYKAPELLSEVRGPVSYPSDVYAYGIVFSQILFATIKKKDIYYAPDKITQTRFPRVLQTFLTELTDPIPSARPDTVMAMGHSWFSNIDWNTVIRCGYQNPYKPTYKGPLSLNVTLERIPRLAKRKREIAPAHDEDLLTGFNYVAPQHYESSQVDQVALCTTTSTTFDGIRLITLRSKGDSFNTVDALSPEVMRVPVTDNIENSDRGLKLKERYRNWKRSLRHSRKRSAENGANAKVGTVNTIAEGRHRNCVEESSLVEKRPRVN